MMDPWDESGIRKNNPWMDDILWFGLVGYTTIFYTIYNP